MGDKSPKNKEKRKKKQAEKKGSLPSLVPSPSKPPADKKKNGS